MPAGRAPAGAVLHATARHTLKMMRPAPVIRMRGRATPGGARITLLYPGARNPRRCPSV